LCARLEARARAAHELRLRLQLEPRVADEQAATVQELNPSSPDSHNVIHNRFYERVLRLPVAMRDTKIFLKLLQLDLAGHPPGAPVKKLWLEAQPAPPRSAQRGLFLPVVPEPEKLEITLARINAVVGERRAGIARLLDSHRRDGFQVDRFKIPGSETLKSLTATLSDNDYPPVAMRLIRPACELKVQILEGRPVFLAPEKKSIEQGNLHGKVTWSSGPWRSSGDWWTENAKEEHSGPWDREEWDIALAIIGNGSDGQSAGMALYRIYRDIGTGQWFADASYD